MNNITTLPQRLEVCASRAGGKRSLAQISGISESQFYRYLTDASSIPADNLTAIAHAANVNLGWLISGEGTPEGPQPQNPRPPFRPQLLAEIAQKLDIAVLEYEQRITPVQRGHILTFIYEALRHDEEIYNQPINFSKINLTAFLDFLAIAPVNDSISSHQMALSFIEHKESPSTDIFIEKMLDQWATTISKGYQNYFSKPSGHLFFDVVGYDVGEVAAQRLHKMMAQLSPENNRPHPIKMLDLGCGNGRELAFILKHYPWVKGHGIDIADSAVKAAKNLEKSGKLPLDSIQHGSMYALPYPDETFDFIYSRLAFRGCPYVEGYKIGAVRAIEELNRVLKSGGTAQIASAAGNHRDYLPFAQYYNQNLFIKLIENTPTLQLTSWEEPPPPSKIWHESQDRINTYFLANIKKR